MIEKHQTVTSDAEGTTPEDRIVFVKRDDDTYVEVYSDTFTQTGPSEFCVALKLTAHNVREIAEAAKDFLRN